MTGENRDFVPAEEKEKTITYGRIDPKNRQEISGYYGFELVNKFSEVAKKTTFKKMINYRQEQMRQGCLEVATARCLFENIRTELAGPRLR